MVPDGDGHRVAVRGHRDDHVPALAVVNGVDQEIAHDALDPPPVGLGHARPGGQPELDPRPAALGQVLRDVSRPPDQVADVHRLGVQGRGVRVVPADLQQVGEQRLEPLQLALQQLGRPGGGAVQLVPRGVQDVRGDPDRGQRGAQLVRHV